MASLVLARLTSRKLLKISGPDCYPYLQGLISNDLRYLYEPDRIPKSKHAKGTPNVLSTFMLNAQGRAICDMLIYRTLHTRSECQFSPPEGGLDEPDELFIECEAKLASGLANTLYGYRVRRKISIFMRDNLAVWCLFPKFDTNKSETSITQSEGNPLATIPNPDEVLSKRLTVVNDPRLASLGTRIISRDSDFNEVKNSIQSFINADIQEGSLKDYIVHRYTLGVGEGVDDHPESFCLPLECNADLLNSVSFSKGCYLGQELTARIHYTGVVRKRLMPVIIDSNTHNQDTATAPLIANAEIYDTITNRKVGVLRHRVGNRGLALLRHDMVSGPHELFHDGSKTKLSTYRPYWWDSDKKIS